jgi:hypothetical protein
VKGIEPSSQAWEAHILPLNHTRTGKKYLGKLIAEGRGRNGGVGWWSLSDARPTASGRREPFSSGASAGPSTQTDPRQPINRSTGYPG